MFFTACMPCVSSNISMHHLRWTQGKGAIFCSVCVSNKLRPVDIIQYSYLVVCYRFSPMFFKLQSWSAVANNISIRVIIVKSKHLEDNIQVRSGQKTTRRRNICWLTCTGAHTIIISGSHTFLNNANMSD